MDSSLHGNLDLFGEGEKKPPGILMTVLITYRNVSIYLRVGHRQLQVLLQNSRAHSLVCTCGTGGIPGTATKPVPFCTTKTFQFLNNQSQPFSSSFLSPHCSSQLRWQRCRKTGVMNCISSIQTSALPSTILTGKYTATLKRSVARGWQKEKAPAVFHNTVMVYQSGNKRAPEEQGARSLQSPAGCAQAGDIPNPS